MTSWDESIFLWLNSYARVSPALDRVIIFLAEYLWYLIIAAVLAIWLVSFFPRWSDLRKKHIELFLLALFSSVIARFAVTEFIRFFVPRARPFEVFEFIAPLISHDPS